MRVLFVITSSDKGTWLSEVTHPYWHLTERGVQVDFASPLGGKVGWTPRSDPYFQESQEPYDLVSKGFLSDDKIMSRLRRRPNLRTSTWTPMTQFMSPVAAVLPSIFIPMRHWRQRSNISGHAARSGPSAAEPFRSLTIRAGSRAAGRRHFPSTRTASSKASSGVASSSRTTRKRRLKRSARNTRRLDFMLLTSSWTAS
jgi:hypothetical protein